MERPCLRVEPSVVTRRDRPVDARRDVGVEPDLAFVKAKRVAGLPAYRVGGGNLEYDGVWAVAAVNVRQVDAVALAHLARADALEHEFAHRHAKRSGEPFGGQVGGPLHDVSGAHWSPRCENRPRPTTGCGRRTQR